MVVEVASLRALIVFAILLCGLSAAANFTIDPYLYSTEKNAQVDYVTFATQSNDTAKIVEINGEMSMLLVNDQLVSDKDQISSIVGEYYQENYYPSQSDLAELKGYADAFNKSRNYVTRYGQAEQICMQYTFLSLQPCSDYQSCYQTAQMVCTITGAEGCEADLLATYIADYATDVSALNAAYSKFNSAYYSVGPTTVTSSLNQMSTAFDAMKTAADQTGQNKLRFDSSCMDCVGMCPEPNFDYASITSGKAEVASLAAKTEPYATLQQVTDSMYITTGQRIAYRDGEEKAAVFQPKYDALMSEYGGLESQAVEAKSLVGDAAFAPVVNSFLNNADQLESKFEKRDFDGFEALLSGYESSAKSLLAVINNSTVPYRDTMSAQNDTVAELIQAQWSVNRLSSSSIAAYNSLVDRKGKLDARLKPPMTSAQYNNLTADYRTLETDAKAYVESSSGLEGSVFNVGNSIGRTSVDGAMAIASSMVPISFKTRQSLAKYVPPVVLAAVDLTILAVGLLLFVAIFYYFHGFFRSKLAVSGWALSMLAFVFVLLVGSVGFYSIVLSTEKFTSWADFAGTVASSGRVAIIVEQGGVDGPTVSDMRSCADQIGAQLASQGKQILKYYIDNTRCSYSIPRAAAGANNTTTYDTKTDLPASSCLDSMPDVPVIDLQYSSTNEAPTFTTVVTKQAIFKGNDDFYSKKPMCDPATVLG